MMNLFILTFIFLLLLKVIVSTVLEMINLRFLRNHSSKIPECFRDFIDSNSYLKSVDYTIAKSRFSIVQGFYEATILGFLILGGVLPILFNFFSESLGYGVWSQSLVFCLILFLIGLPSIPFDWWSTFRIEERFGFNKSSPKLWLSDKLKSGFIALLLGIPIVALLLYCVRLAGSAWWIYGFVVIYLFQLVMVVVYPMFIMPVFNKLEPIEEGNLKKRLFALSERTGFKTKSILVMDGSKRSGHSNAFFAGFGSFRRIVLYDTLIEQMSESQIEAVLAHEIGHYKLGHIPKMLLLSGVMSFSLFALLGWLSSSSLLAHSFYFTGLSLEQLILPIFLLFLTMGGLISYWMSPIGSAISRRHEYEADAFANQAMGDSQPLMSALRQLHTENLSNLTPHPLYSSFYYSHPTLMEREAAMQ